MLAENSFRKRKYSVLKPLPLSFHAHKALSFTTALFQTTTHKVWPALPAEDITVNETDMALMKSIHR